MGGATAFADTRTAYDDLSDDLKAELVSQDYIAFHSMHHSRKLASPEYFADLDPLQYPMGKHRLVQRHEASGRMNLYVAAHVHHLEGPDGQQPPAKLFEDLYKHACDDKYIVQIEWQNAGDMIIWDNTCVMHRALGGEFRTKYRRDMRRVTVHDGSSTAWGLNEKTDKRAGMP
jgi:alpha-ketoglutarate-dependent 2,4-dichlorophenoxyacetate dioxygenase